MEKDKVFMYFVAFTVYRDHVAIWSGDCNYVSGIVPDTHEEYKALRAAIGGAVASMLPPEVSGQIRLTCLTRIN